MLLHYISRAPQKSIGANHETCWYLHAPLTNVAQIESRETIGRLGDRVVASGALGPEETEMEPDLEVVQIRPGESFAAWSHGYPYRTVRWHFHPEYELHLVVATTGRYFVGDFIGEFEPGNLVLTGPNLPHNWVSDIPKGASIPLALPHHPVQRELHHRRCQAALPELAASGTGCWNRRDAGCCSAQRQAGQISPLMQELMLRKACAASSCS